MEEIDECLFLIINRKTVKGRRREEVVCQERAVDERGNRVNLLERGVIPRLGNILDFSTSNRNECHSYHSRSNKSVASGRFLRFDSVRRWRESKSPYLLPSVRWENHHSPSRLAIDTGFANAYRLPFSLSPPYFSLSGLLRIVSPLR